ncbi:MAG: hypothetical protein GY947_02135 [Rhodobacteraceae bacterium]|nr:hypothetical protein [Paracoccaceae bacterium]
MLTYPSLTLRIGIGKTVGLVIGLAGFVFLPFFAADAGWMLRWGILLWYTTLGAIIGVFGVYTSHPVLHIPFPWWVRAPFIGAWMNFVLTFFVYDEFRAMMIAAFGSSSGPLTSPFLFALEGAVAGLIIGGVTTRFAGEGRETVGHLAE